MLDLECAAIGAPNPALIEIAAIFFDIDTGKELRHFTTPDNFESSMEHDLVTDSDTENWLRRNVPETLQTSKATTVTLPKALQQLSEFIERCHGKTKCESKAHEDSQVMIWGNGSTSDNVWIDSAYKACNVKKPWLFYNDMCVRTFVKQCAFMTGRDFSREVGRRGPKHIALEDCKHQILYLVKARNHLMPGGSAAIPRPSGQGARRKYNIETISPCLLAKRMHPTPADSFSENVPEGDNDYGNRSVKRVNHGLEAEIEPEEEGELEGELELWWRIRVWGTCSMATGIPPSTPLAQLDLTGVGSGAVSLMPSIWGDRCG